MRTYIVVLKLEIERFESVSKKGLEFDCYFKMVLNPFCNLTQTTILPLLLWENGKEDKFPQMLFDHHSSCLHFLFVDVRARWRAARVEIS